MKVTSLQSLLIFLTYIYFTSHVCLDTHIHECTYVCVRVCVYVFVCAHALVYGGRRSTSGVGPPAPFPDFFLDRISHRPTVQHVGWLVSKAPGTLPVSAASAGILSKYHCALLFPHGFWGSNSGPLFERKALSRLSHLPSPWPIFLNMYLQHKYTYSKYQVPWNNLICTKARKWNFWLTNKRKSKRKNK